MTGRRVVSRPRGVRLVQSRIAGNTRGESHVWSFGCETDCAVLGDGDTRRISRSRSSGSRCRRQRLSELVPRQRLLHRSGVLRDELRVRELRNATDVFRVFRLSGAIVRVELPSLRSFAGPIRHRLVAPGLRCTRLHLRSVLLSVVIILVPDISGRLRSRCSREHFASASASRRVRTRARSGSPLRLVTSRARMTDAGGRQTPFRHDRRSRLLSLDRLIQTTLPGAEG
jgi:hypothetical protein